MLNILYRTVCANVIVLLATPSLAATVGDFPRAKVAVIGGTYLNDALLKQKALIKGSFTVKTKVGMSPTIGRVTQ